MSWGTEEWRNLDDTPKSQVPMTTKIGSWELSNIKPYRSANIAKKPRIKIKGKKERQVLEAFIAAGKPAHIGEIGEKVGMHKQRVSERARSLVKKNCLAALGRGFYEATVR